VERGGSDGGGGSGGAGSSLSSVGGRWAAACVLAIHRWQIVVVHQWGNVVCGGLLLLVGVVTALFVVRHLVATSPREATWHLIPL